MFRTVFPSIISSLRLYIQHQVYVVQVLWLLSSGNEMVASSHSSSDSQAALKALQATKITSPLVRECQKALNDISSRHTVGMYWVPGNAGIQGNKIASRLARDGSVHRFVGPEPFLGVSRQNIRRMIKRWMENQHLVL